MRITLIFAILAALLVPVNSLAAVPVYSAEYAGPGQSVAVNSFGVVVGNESTVYPGQPWVNDGGGPQDLPLPDGVLGGRVSDINDHDQIVGTVYPDGQLTSDLPAIWTPDGAGGYEVELLPLAGSATRGTGVALNNLGQILVSGFGVDALLPTYRAYVIDGSDVDPLPLSNPITINDNGIVLTEFTLFDYPNMLDLGLPAPPDGLSAIAMYPSDLNNRDEVAITLLTAIISYTRYQAIGTYTINGSWNMITGVVTNMSSGPLNDSGDLLVNGGSCNTMVYLAGLGFYCPGSLLDPADTNWTLGRALDVGNDGSLLAYGSNSTTGESGAVLMTAIGDLDVPAAPIGLAAIPHVPTAQQNFVSIDVSWHPADDLTQSYMIERRGPDDVGFLELAATTNQFYRDMLIVSGEIYSYRIRAVGLAGISDPSAVVSVVAPAQGDTEAPVITSVSLENGDIVTGVVNIDLTATDNVAVSLIRVDAPGMNQPCDTFNSATASCQWDTTGLTAGTYSVHVSASDAMGNGVLEIIAVTVEASATDGGKGGGKASGNKGGGKGGGKGAGKPEK